MLTLLRSGSAEADDGMASLWRACHGRIRHFTGLALRLARAQGTPPAEVVEAAAAVHRYFSLALPLHEQDEEESLAPRLRGKRPEVDACLAGMEAEHREQHPHVARLLALCSSLREDPGQLEALDGALLSEASALEALFARHLAEEERVLLPAFDTLLDEAAREAIRAEMRARRQG